MQYLYNMITPNGGGDNNSSSSSGGGKGGANLGLILGITIPAAVAVAGAAIFIVLRKKVK